MMTRGLLLLGVVLVLVGAVGLVRWLPSKPLAHIEVSGTFRHVSLDQVHAVIEDQFGRDLLKVKLDDVQRKVATLVWVDHVDVRRVWPDGLEINLTEHQAAYRWRDAHGQQALVAKDGEIIWDASSATQDDYQALPLLIGDGAGVAVLAEAYNGLSELLGQALPIQQLERSDFHAWSAVVDGKPVHLGMGLVGGLPDEAEANQKTNQLRVARLKAIHSELQSEWSRVKYLDLRHVGGVAVAWL